MRIGILQCGHAPDAVRQRHGDFDDLFKALFAGYDLSFTRYDVEAMEFPSGVDAQDGWLVTGSRHGVYEDHAFIAPLEDFIRAAHAAKRPVIGICFGHQIIAKAMGAHVAKSEKGWGFGAELYHSELLGPVQINAIHQDQVQSLPEGARLVASNSFCPYAALDYGTMRSIQPHPEFDQAVMASYIEALGAQGRIPEPLLEKARGELGAGLDTARVVAWLYGVFSTQKQAQTEAAE